MRALSPLDRRIFLGPGLALSLLVTLIVVDVYVVLSNSEQMQAERETLQWDLQQFEERRHSAQADLDFLAENGERYDALVEQGWGKTPDRLAAARLLEVLADEYRLSALDYSFLPEQREPMEGGRDFERVRTDSAIEMRIDATLDADVTGFLSALQEQLPGILRIDQLEIERIRALSPDDLQSIRSGQSIAFVESRIFASWQNVQAGEQSR